MHVSADTTASGLGWVLRHTNERMVHAMAQQLGMDPLLASILVGRGVDIDHAGSFLLPTLRDALPDPLHLRDMPQAVARLLVAIRARETIAVFGDYDVDGATSTALLMRYFEQLGMKLHYYIPDRLKEGYGPTVEAFTKLIAGKNPASLILTVDCGTLAHEPIAYAQRQGVDVIVIDHHLSTGALPPAHAVINPNRVDETTEHRQLAAVGVTFLLLVALNAAIRERLGELGLKENALPNLLTFLDLVALGTVCDVMPLTGLNRAYVAQGLKVLRKRQHEGLRALCDVARLNEVPGSYHLGFLLGPRINAGGRVGEADLGVRLLTTHDAAERERIAEQLHHLNAERQAIEARVLEQALEHADRQANAPVIVVAQEAWHAGVIGIVAARLKEKFSRPAAVVAIENGQGKGSARSVLGADFGAAIHAAQLAGIVDSGGGHAMAAGFTLPAHAIPALQDFLCQRLSSAVAAYSDARVRTIDGWLGLGGANVALLEALSKAEPFGIGNPSPRFGIRQATIVHREVMKQSHLRIALADEAGHRLSAVAFHAVGTRLGEWLLAERQLHLAGELKRNHWQGRETAQFLIEDAAMVG